MTTQDVTFMTDPGNDAYDIGPPKRLVVSVCEAAELLDISCSLARRLVARGEIPSKRLGGRIVIPLAKLDEMLAA